MKIAKMTYFVLPHICPWNLHNLILFSLLFP